MLTNTERQNALSRAGYGEREAQFLCLAALQGGYFLRRQYAEFLGTQDGGTITQLIEKILDKNHAEVATYRANMHMYHLSARPFYAALGQENNRNRRRKEPLTIKAKLMGLDFVLANQQHEYLATEHEKLDFFETTLNINRRDLPAKRYASNGQVTERYFVEKFPLFLAHNFQELRAASPHFAFVDPGQSSVLAFETFLNRYRRLFTRLREFTVVYVAGTDRLFEKAGLLFERVSRGLGVGTPAINLVQNSTKILEYFEARHLFDTKQFASLDRQKLSRLRAGREAFSGPEMEALYGRWKQGSPAIFTDDSNVNNDHLHEICGRFSTYLLKHSYDLFGSVTAY